MAILAFSLCMAPTPSLSLTKPLLGPLYGVHRNVVTNCMELSLLKLLQMPSRGAQARHVKPVYHSTLSPPDRCLALCSLILLLIVGLYLPGPQLIGRSISSMLT